MKNEKICKMIEILKKRQNKFKGELLKELKTEENLEVASRVFMASDKTWCRKTSDKYKDALYQARRTTAECLNMLFWEDRIDFRAGDISLYQKLEMYVVSRDHIRFLSDYTENNTAILFSEDVDIARDISDNSTWLAEIDGGRIEYTLFCDRYNKGWSTDIQSKPGEETIEKVKTWYKEHDFNFKED